MKSKLTSDKSDRVINRSALNIKLILYIFNINRAFNSYILTFDSPDTLYVQIHFLFTAKLKYLSLKSSFCFRSLFELLFQLLKIILA